MTNGAEFPRVDALFAGEPPIPKLDGKPIIRSIRRILWVAIPLDVLAIPLWTGVPGALLTLWAWLKADSAMRLVQDGRFDVADARVLRRQRKLAAWALIFISLSFLLQIWLMWKPGYTRIYSGLFGSLS